MSALLDELRDRLPPGGLATDPDVCAGYELDATGRYRGRALAIARPRDAAQVADVVAACARHGQPLVVQGGNTGLVGAGVPRDGELVLSLRALADVGEVDRDALQVTVGAGATLERVQSAAAAAGLELPLDHGARAAATIGGGVATNAGGSFAMRHGSMRERVVGLEVVVPAFGVVSRMAGLVKDNAGYDLVGLMVGSEGTLGVVTAARLQLVPALPARLTALLGVEDLDAALGLLRTLRGVDGLEAVDVLDAASMALACEQLRARAPLEGSHGWYAIAQWAGRIDVTEQLAAALERDAPGIEVVAAVERADRARLWRHRESLNEAIRARGVPHKLDVGLPIARLPAFERELRRRLAARSDAVRLYLFGHLGDGNLHVNVLGPPPDDESVDDLVLACVVEHGGTISAEHGVGREKRRWLHACRSPADLAAMAAIKRALDPDGILGPGRVLPAG